MVLLLLVSPFPSPSSFSVLVLFFFSLLVLVLLCHGMSCHEMLCSAVLSFSHVCVMLCYATPSCVTLMSYDFLCHATPCCVMFCHVMRIVSCPVVIRHVMLCHVMPFHVLSGYVHLNNGMPSHLMLCFIVQIVSYVMVRDAMLCECSDYCQNMSCSLSRCMSFHAT